MRHVIIYSRRGIGRTMDGKKEKRTEMLKVTELEIHRSVAIHIVNYHIIGDY